VRILLLMGVLHPVVLLALVLLAGAGVAVLAPAAVLAGATVPPLGAVLRAIWPRLVPGEALITAYAFESVVVELCFVGGPLLAFVEDDGGRPGAAGVLLAVWSVGSIVGGLTYGAVHPSTPHRRQLPVLIGALALGTLLPLLVDGSGGGGFALMCLALLGYGLAIAPFFACNSVLLAAAAPDRTVTETFAWNSSMIFGGAALGAAGAGLLVERSGVVAALGVTAFSGLVALLLSLRAVRRLPSGVPV